MKKERKIRVDLTLDQLQEIKLRIQDRMSWTEEKKRIAMNSDFNYVGMIGLCNSIIDRLQGILDKINPAIEKEILRYENERINYL